MQRGVIEGAEWKQGRRKGRRKGRWEAKEGECKKGQSGKRATGKAEKREGGKQNKVNEIRDRVERGQQKMQKKGKVGSKIRLMKPGTEWKEGIRKCRRKGRGKPKGVNETRDRVERGQQERQKKGKVGSVRYETPGTE
jgi:hypothetical protein